MSHCIYPNGKGQLLPIVLLTQLTICKGLRFSFLNGGPSRTRTDNILLAGQALYHWSYEPIALPAYRG